MGVESIAEYLPVNEKRRPILGILSLAFVIVSFLMCSSFVLVAVAVNVLESSLLISTDVERQVFALGSLCMWGSILPILSSITLSIISLAKREPRNALAIIGLSISALFLALLIGILLIGIFL